MLVFFFEKMQQNYFDNIGFDSLIKDLNIDEKTILTLYYSLNEDKKTRFVESYNLSEVSLDSIYDHQVRHYLPREKVPSLRS